MTNELNELKLGQVLAEVGLSKYRDVEDIVLSLYGPNIRLEYRYAPSIVLRSEAEIFDVSTPRFAIRVLIISKADEQLLGVINLRRLLTFMRQGPCWLESSPDCESPSPAEIQWKANAIADSFFSTPEYLKGKFTVLAMEWDHLVGERVHAARIAPSGTPFMTHIRLGGGMCAQACAFMCATLLHRFSHSVQGLAEITRLARPEGAEMQLSGLAFGELQNYFGSVGLRSTVQQVLSSGRSGGLGKNVDLTVFGRGLRAYLKSGFPVVIGVDMNRMQGQWETGGKVNGHDFGIYQTNRHLLPGSLKFLCEKPNPPTVPIVRHHAVVVVGCDHTVKDVTRSEVEIQGERVQAVPILEENRFLLHDPASVPFLVAPIDLIAASMLLTTKKRNKGTKSMRPASPNSEQAPAGHNDFELTKPVCLPVTPEKVKVHLLDAVRDEKRIEGLLRRVSEYRIRYVDSHPNPQQTTLPLPTPWENDFEYMICGMVTDLPVKCKLLSPKTAPKKEKLKEVLSVVADRWGWETTHWVWCDFVANGFWIWDAEGEFGTSRITETSDQRTGFLRAVYDTENECLYLTSREEPDRGLELFQIIGQRHTTVEPTLFSPVTPKTMRTIRPSCLTSFTVKGVSEAVRNLGMTEFGRDRHIPIEVYLCMQGDADEWFANQHRRSKKLPFKERLSNFLGSAAFYRSMHQGIQVWEKVSGERWNELVRDFARSQESYEKQKLSSAMGSAIYAVISSCFWRIAAPSDYPMALKRFHPLLYKWLHRSVESSRASATSMMGSAGRLRGAKRALEALRRYDKVNPIIAFASYIPEISSGFGSLPSSPQFLKWKRAVKALRTIVWLAGRFRASARRTNTVVIELVAGNMLIGIRPIPDQRKRGGKPNYSARLAPADGAKRTLLERLLPVGRDAERQDVYLALELEPGPLSVIGSLADIRELADLLDKDPMFCETPLSRRLGFNLDLAHWAFLAKIRPSELLDFQNRGVWRRIVHAHISDHSAGHFADNELLTINPAETFQPWLDLLQRRAEDTGCLLPFSGHISMELEACRTRAQMARSLSTLWTWLADP